MIWFTSFVFAATCLVHAQQNTDETKGRANIQKLLDELFHSELNREVRVHEPPELSPRYQHYTPYQFPKSCYGYNCPPAVKLSTIDQTKDAHSMTPTVYAHDRQAIADRWRGLGKMNSVITVNAILLLTGILLAIPLLDWALPVPAPLRALTSAPLTKDSNREYFL